MSYHTLTVMAYDMLYKPDAELLRGFARSAQPRVPRLWSILHARANPAVPQMGSYMELHQYITAKSAERRHGSFLARFFATTLVLGTNPVMPALWGWCAAGGRELLVRGYGALR